MEQLLLTTEKSSPERVFEGGQRFAPHKCFIIGGGGGGGGGVRAGNGLGCVVWCGSRLTRQ